MKTKNIQNLSILGAATTLAFTPAATSAAHAQNKPVRMVAAINDTVRMAVGERVVLPYANVTRIITDDDEIARAFFQSGSAVLEGTASGSTTVEIYQTTGTPKVLTVQVGGPAAAPVTPNGSPLTPISPSYSPGLAPTTNLPDQTPLTPAPAPLPEPGSAVAPRSPLLISLGVAPAPGNSSQAVFTITYGNPGLAPAQNVVVRFPLDEGVSFVPGSGSPGARYDAALREVSWNIGIVPAGQVDQKLTLRVAPIENRPLSFDSSAFIEDASKTGVASNLINYTNTTTPLLTVFALPDRFLAGRNGPVLADVKGLDAYTAVARLNALGVAKGRAPGLFFPAAPAKRSEYAVMTLNGLNLRDLRDITQIKFVLGRRSTVNLTIVNAAGKTVASLIRDTNFDVGEHTEPWDGHIGATYAPPGRYSYVCTAKDADPKNPRGATTKLVGTLNIVPQTPLNPSGMPSFVDVKPSDWFARYLAVGQKQGLLKGFPDNTFRPDNAISRVEATAIVVRALGLEDLAKQWNDKSVPFLDYDAVPPWARGAVNVATTVAKTSAGRAMIRGDLSNFFRPEKQLRRDEAALIVQRLIDRETTRRITVSGAIVPGTTVTINSRNVGPNDQGQFGFSFDLNTAELPTVVVIDTRDRGI